MAEISGRPPMTARPPRHRRARGKTLLYLLPVIIAVAAGGIWYLSTREGEDKKGGKGGRKKKGTSSLLDVVGRVPETSPIVLTISRPSEMLRDLASRVKSLSQQSPEIGSGWEKARASSREVLGFDFTDPAAWSKDGFDLSAPLTVAFQEFDRRGEFQGVVFSVGVTDGEKARGMIERAARREKADVRMNDGDPEVMLIDDDTAVAVLEGRLYVAGGEDEDDMAAVLRNYLSDARRRPLSKNTDFRAAARGVAGKGLLGGYVNLRAVIASISQRTYGPPPPSITKDLVAVTFRCDEKGTSAYLLLDGESGLLGFLDPGAECRDFLARMDEPLAAYSFSMARPLEFMLHFMREMGAGDQVDVFKSQMNTVTGLTFADLASQVRNGAGGAALYPAQPGQRFVPLSVANFFRVNDRSAALAALERAMAQQVSMNAVQVEKHGENVLYNKTGPFMSTSFGIVGEYIVSGNAVTQIRNLASGRAAG